MVLKQIFVLLAACGLVFNVGSISKAADDDWKNNTEVIREKTADSRRDLERRNGTQSKTHGTSSGEGVYKSEEIEPHLPEIKEEVKEKPIFEIHGGLVGFFQGSPESRIEGEHAYDAYGPGITADLQLSFRPPLYVFQDGRFFMRLHAGAGKGSDRILGDKLFANLNTVADNSDDLQKDTDKAFWLPEAYYVQELFGGKITFTFGKTEPVVFIDDNTFANNPNSQFVGKPFVNNPVFNSEDEYAPILAAAFSPVESISIRALAVSSSYPNAPDETTQKSVYTRIFDQPLIAAQFAYSPKFGELQGNYRVYVWDATYDHMNSAGDTSPQGWGIGVSIDQQVTEWLGFFARLAYSDKNAYDVDWFWSVGTNLKGLIPGRDKDELGIGLAGLKGTVGPDNDGTELHTEVYYRFALNEYLAVSPDVQYVANPLGNSNNDGVFAGMVRVELSF